MSDLPNPASANSGALSSQSTRLSLQNTGQQLVTDPKALEAQAIERIEAIVQQTNVNPAERAEKVHEVKVAYVKARFNIDMKGKA